MLLIRFALFAHFLECKEVKFGNVQLEDMGTLQYCQLSLQSKGLGLVQNIHLPVDKYLNIHMACTGFLFKLKRRERHDNKYWYWEQKVKLEEINYTWCTLPDVFAFDDTFFLPLLLIKEIIRVQFLRKLQPLSHNKGLLYISIIFTSIDFMRLFLSCSPADVSVR